MHKAIILLSLLAISGFATSTHFQELNLLWSTWKNIHNKQYSATPEEGARYAIFVDNYNKIVKYNAEHKNVKLGLNKFADLTAQEFKHKHSGCAFIQDRDITTQNTIPYELLEIPDSIDWREKKAVTPVKDQGQCGSCWTFSTTGVIEGFHAIKEGKLVSFSEQQIVDCATNAGFGCMGGDPTAAIDYAGKNGLEEEDSYPYKAVDGECQYDKKKAVQANTKSELVKPNSVKALKSALAQQPVAVAIEADQEVFQFYEKGVIGPDDNCGGAIDHAVLVVGYGKKDGTDVFIVKNSWGKTWGQDGYILFAADEKSNGGTGVCGILTQPVIAK